MPTLTIPARFQGPPNSGNGGYSCGVIARFVEGTPEVTLRRPIPLERALTVERDAESLVRLLDGAEVLAEARPATLALEVPACPAWDATEAAMRRYAGFQRHGFPHCFVCGPARAAGDGLRIFAGPVEGRPLVAAPWTPDPSLADAGGVVQPEFLWAALDCPGYFAALGDVPFLPALLGRMTAAVEPGIRAGERCTVVGWRIAQQGRKHVVGTALFDARGNCAAKALATWIALT